MTPALIILLLCGLVLRLAIATLFFPHSGFATDLSSYVSWAETLYTYGPGGFYANAGFADYPPGYLYLLWPIGHLAHLQLPGFLRPEDLIKVVPILLDLVVAFALFCLVRSWSGATRHANRLALGAAALYLFNPVSWYDSALWGQTDAAGALVMLLCVAALIRGNAEGTTAMAVVAAMVKPQFGVVMIPLVALVLLKRHLFVVGSGPHERPLLRGAPGQWLARHQGPERLVTSFVTAWVVFFAIALPFGMGPIEYLTFLARTAGGYDYVTVNAYNLWALIGIGGQPPLASSDFWIKDTLPFLGPVPAVVVGAVLLVAGFVWTLAGVYRRPQRNGILIAAVVLSAAFFVLPTRVHERYLFPVFVFLPILAVWSRRWRWVLLAFAVGSFMNLHAILTQDNPVYGTPNVASLPFGALLRTYPFVALAVALQAGAFLYAAWQLRRSTDDPALEEMGLGEETQTVEERLAAGLQEGMPRGPRPVRVAQPASNAAVTSEPVARGGAIGGPRREAVDAGWTGRPGLASWIDARLGTLWPARRDRSAELAAERHGRWDRLDLLLVVVITVASFTLRGFHLEQPYDMYFDEVYHARTATEFLQHWRYGIVHSIYEYTHPHLAKYAMALGLEAFGNNTVTGTTSLPQSMVIDAAVEPRWSPGSAPERRNGDRLYVLDGRTIGVYDLATRAQVTQIGLAQDATAVTLDKNAHVLYVATGNAISRLDTTTLDALRAATATTIPPPSSVASVSGTRGTIKQLTVVDSSVIVRTDAGWLASVATADGRQSGSAQLAGAKDAERVPATNQVIADPSAVTDPAGEAQTLADDLAQPVARIRPLLTAKGTHVSLGGYLSQTDRDAVNADITAGKLPGITIESSPVVAVSGSRGVTFLDAVGLRTLTDVTFSGAEGMVLVEHGLDVPTLYVATESQGTPKLETVGLRDPAPILGSSLTMPGPVHDVVWNESANLVHVVGRAPDGAPTVYVVEPHGNSVFADAQLPFQPVEVLSDTQPDRPQADRMQLIALATDGRLATIDVGHNAFAWRLPGVAMGSLTTACIYLLARLLFRRRSVAVIAAVLVMAGGMFFANARIAMNDTYVTGFIVAAVTLFTPLYLGIWRRRWQVVAGLIGVGVLLGLALASKWVGAYAIGGLMLLVLLRSALGRIVALAGMIAMTAALGALAIRAPNVPQPHTNVFFLLLMLVLTVALAIAMVRRPIRMAMDELRFAVVAPAVLGVALVAVGFLLASKLPREGLFAPGKVTLAGAACLLGGAGAYAIAWQAGHLFRRGPLAPAWPVPRDEPVPAHAPSGWLRPGHSAGIAWLFALACLAIIPVGIYVASYVPWFNLGNQLIQGVPAGNGSGNTLWTLTLQMYDYHNNLRAGHAASSPWWAWPFDLKPVWFYQHGFANTTTGVIYDAENLVLLWLAIPAVAFAAWAAWHRRSLSLAVVVLLFAAMWLPWARIDRATFQYHVFTSLPFATLALAYFLAELWHGPGPGTWLLARGAAAVAILGPPLLWIARQPLCILAGSSAAHTAEGGGDGIACAAITRSTQVSEAAVASSLVLLGGLLVLGCQLWLLYRAGGAAGGPIRLGRFSVPAEAAPFATLLAILAAVVLAIRVFSPDPVFTLSVGADEVALVGLAALAIPAWLVLRARDSRRFVIGVLIAAVLWFVAWYPNLSGLPLPNSIANIYQGLLPTWNYDFWFAVNKDEPATSSIAEPALLLLAVTVALVAATIVATHWLRPEKPTASDTEAQLPESA